MRCVRCNRDPDGPSAALDSTARRPASPALGLLLTAALAAVLPVPAPAQDWMPGWASDRPPRPLVHRAWGLEDGLPQSSVNDLLQDRDGYLWVATFGGLARFDGMRFHVLDVASHPNLPGHRFLSLAEGADGTLWAGTDSHGLVRVRHGRAERFVPPHGAPVGSVQALAVAPDGALWVGGDGLARLGPDGSWRRYGLGDGLPAPRVLSLLVADDGSLWVGTVRGVARWAAGRFVALPEPDVDVFSLLRDAGGAVWIGGGRGQVYRWDGAALETWRLPGEGRVRALLRDRAGELWVGADPGGVFRFAGGTQAAGSQAAGSLVAGAAGMDRVVDLLQDREGNLWVGSSRHGLHQLRVGEAVAFGDPGRSGDPLGGPVVPVLDDGAGGVWAGVPCDGVVHLAADGRTRLFAAAEGFSNTCVWSLAPDGAGGLWVGTLGGGLYRLRDGRARWQRGPPTAQRAVHALYRAGDGSLYAGTDDGVFRVLPGGETAFRRLPGTAGLRVYHIAETPLGGLWLGSDDGAWEVPPGDGAPQAATPAAAPPARRLHPDLAGLPVRAVHHGLDGALWLGTYGHGLFRWDGRRLARLTTRHGLPENVVSFIAEDEAGRFWLTGNRGVTRVQRARLEAVALGRAEQAEAVLFTAGDGMPSSETNGGGQPAGQLTADGRLWVPTLAGLARFDTRHGGRNAFPPPVRIEGVWLGGEPVAPGEDLRLAAGARNLEIRYTGLSLGDPERLRFRYRLRGLDREWTEADRRRVAYYPFLPAGHHVFEVTARTPDGVWSREAAELAFIVEPRFAETPWAWLLGLAAVAVLVAGVAVLRRRLWDTRRRLEEANRHLEELATVDALTAIPNRRGLMAALEREWKRAVRWNRRLGVLMIDLDRFKQYNDRHGHLAGDRCLCRVVEILGQGLRRADDLLARFGGEELAVVVPEVDAEDLERLAEALRRRVEAAALPHGASPEGPVVTVSIGGAVMRPTLDDPPEELLSAADRALYVAKEAGRNQVVVVVPAAAKPHADDGGALTPSGERVGPHAERV